MIIQRPGFWVGSLTTHCRASVFPVSHIYDIFCYHNYLCATFYNTQTLLNDKNNMRSINLQTTSYYF